MNRINLITLGVQDIHKSLTFYREGLGFKTSVSDRNPEVVFFNNQGTKLALFPVEELAKDIGEELIGQKQGFSGITLAYNADSKEGVDRFIGNARDAGATILKEPETVFWGGYSGYFSDPDGHIWEVAYGDMWEFDENEMLIIK
ncbi:VOC family protein [Oceanobacillus manasiensis]|uniref:VOC family protein n=1 Tax=Oceanobacillus manasiensis TaxID=586413 RepID=UPI0005AB7683|nr:VOC family protein [Oceanobacillus manasiensis]